MTLETLDPNQSEQDMIPESETLAIECATTNAFPPPQAETAERGTGFALRANPVSKTAAVYPYSPLPANSIRLLRLRPHSDERALVQCQLLEYSLSDSGRGTHLYEALSYVWGSEEKPRRVSTDKGDLYITENLYAALLRLRDRSFERIIWVDAICINQDDIEERNHQVQAMASIYAKASRVIVWLEEGMDSHPGDSEVSDNVRRALELISKAASGELVKSSDDEAAHLAIRTLLQRSWFERIWVLQEVAAARHVLMMFHSVDMDGFAFFTGLAALNHDFKDPDTQNRIRSAAYLIKGAGLRPKHLATFSHIFSLDICPLGELVDMYHNRMAKDLRDKVYALLGMSSDTPSDLLPDYNKLWRDLFRQLIHSLIGKQALVETWNDRQVAVIKHTGCVLGNVVSVSSAGTWDETQSINVSIDVPDGSERRWKWDGYWNLQASAKSIQQGDVICLLQGASKPTIIRPYKEFCLIVAIAVTPMANKRLEGTPFDWLDCSRRIKAFPRDMLLIWDWETPHVGYIIDYEHFLSSRELFHTKMQKETDDRWSKAARLYYVGKLLKDAKSYEAAIESFQMIITALEETYRSSHQGNEALFEIWRQTSRAIRTDLLWLSWEDKVLDQVVEALETMAEILDRRGDYSEVTEHGVIRTIKGRCGGDLLKLLLAVHENQVPITDEVVKTAAEQELSATEILRLFLDLRGDQVPVGEEVLKTAAKNSSQGKKLFELFLSRRGDMIFISESIVKSAAGNHKHARNIIELLLDRREDQVPITEEVLKIAAGNLYNGKQLIELLLRRCGHQVPITEEVVKIAARNANQAQEIIELLLSRRGHQVPITEEVVNIAARNTYQAKEIIELLLSRRAHQVPITEEVVKIAARNAYQAKEIIELLLSRRGHQVPITEEVVKILAQDRRQGKEFIELLLNWRGDQVPITEEVVKIAAQNRGQGKEVIELLLNRRGDQVPITEEVTKAATETWGRDDPIVRKLHYRYKI